MKRKQGPIYDFWHPRVEGQIRHTIGAHPEYFTREKKLHKYIVGSLAKRIVGEIAAATGVAAVTHGSDERLRPCGCAVVGTTASGAAAGWLRPAPSLAERAQRLFGNQLGEIQ